MDSIKAKLSNGGRIVIPMTYRKELGINPGDEIMLTLEEGEIRLMTARQAINRAQKIVRRYVPEDMSLSDELIQERRKEVDDA